MSTLYACEIFCLDEKCYIKVGYVSILPTLCPNDSSHSIGDIKIIDTIKHESGISVQFHKAEFDDHCNTYNIITEIDCIVKSITFYPNQSNVTEDVFSLLHNIQTIFITEDMRKGDKIMIVSDSSNIKIGNRLRGKQDFGLVTNIEGKNISFSQPATSSYTKHDTVNFSEQVISNLSFSTDKQITFDTNINFTSNNKLHLIAKRPKSNVKILFSIRYCVIEI